MKKLPKFLILGASSWVAKWFVNTSPLQEAAFVGVSRRYFRFNGKLILGDLHDESFILFLVRSEKPDYIVNFCGVGGSSLERAELEACLLYTSPSPRD